VRAINNRGIETDWVYGKHKVIGNTAPPPNVANFTVAVRADGTRSFSWTTNNQPVNVTTGGGYRIRYRNSALNAAWADMTPLHNGLLSQSPLQIADPVAGIYDFAIVSVNASRAESTPAFINDATIGQEPVSYAATANLLFNSDWQLSTGGATGPNVLYGWSVFADGFPILNMGRHHPDGWNPSRGGAWMNDNASFAGNSTYFHHIEQRVDNIIPSVAYEISCLVAVIRCKTMMRVKWYNNSGVDIGTTGNIEYDAGVGLVDSKTLGIGGMVQLWDKVTAPAGASYAIFQLFKYTTTSGQADSFAFWNRAMMCIAPAGATKSTASPWIEAGIDQVHGGSLADLSVNSAQIAAEAATALVSTANGNVGAMPANPATGYGAINSIGFTAPVACQVTLNCTVRWKVYDSRAGSPTSGVQWGEYRVCTRIAPTADGIFGDDGSAAGYTSLGVPDDIGFEHTTTFTRTFPLAAGQSVAIFLGGAGGYTQSGNGASGGLFLNPVWSQMRIEAVKK
jgi:hypothetical protein